MAAVTVTPGDLAPFADIDTAKAVAMIEDAMALAAVTAPCILGPDFEHAAAAKAIIRGAILRRHEAGTGAYSEVSTGPFGATVDTRTARKGMFTGSELDDLKALCSAGGTGKAFSVDTAPGSANVHAETCSVVFGAWCSCGADIAGFPLWDS